MLPGLSSINVSEAVLVNKILYLDQFACLLENGGVGRKGNDCATDKARRVALTDIRVLLDCCS